uniref:Uncharacterized protein n=1 Tax=Vitis vinifera TaxID=29760 RepID=A5BGT6_VITVI|nr:hypothetical protein VITISV_011100 [Vitis vinifera]
MAKANSKSLNLIFMLSLLILVSMAESRFLGCQWVCVDGTVNSVVNYFYPRLEEIKNEAENQLSNKEMNFIYYPIRTTSRKAKPYPRKSKRRRQSVDIRMVSTTHPDDQHEPSGYKSSGWSIKSEKTRGSDSKSLPTIILHNHCPRSLTAASPTMVSDGRS